MNTSSMNLPYAEEIGHYWMTGNKTPADSWMDKTKDLIKEAGGRVIADAFGNQAGQAAFLLEFEIGEDRFKVIWPVLPTKSKNEKAARIQAVTMLHHDVKAKCMTATVMGTRAAFFSYLLLPDGRPATSASVRELETGIPALFKMSAYQQLGEGEEHIMEGEIVG